MPSKSPSAGNMPAPDVSAIGAPVSPVRGNNQAESSTAAASSKKKKHRAGKKRKNRRQSFAAPSEENDTPPSNLAVRPGLEDVPEAPEQRLQSFYRLDNRATKSNESLESEVLLDHRTQNAPRARRPSMYQTSTRPSRSGPKNRPSTTSRNVPNGNSEDEGDDANDRTPLIGKGERRPTSWKDNGYGGFGESQGSSFDRRRRKSSASSKSGRRLQRRGSTQSLEYDVNNPPSQPGSPRLGPENDYDDVMLPEFHSRSPNEARRSMPGAEGREAIIDIDDNSEDVPFEGTFRGSPRSPANGRDAHTRRRSTVTDDVCVPFDNLTEAGDEDDFLHQQSTETLRPRRSRKRGWPDLSALEEWAVEEKEERMLEGVRAKRVSEPMLIGGRLRPQKGGWRRDDEEEPFRWTYFNEELDSSLRSHSLSGLQDLGFNFRELFIPDPPEIIDHSSSDESDDDDHSPMHSNADRSSTPVDSSSRVGTRQSSILEHKGFDALPVQAHVHGHHAHKTSGENTPSKSHSTEPKPKRYGPRPVFWLDVLQPTYDEMRILSRAFGIHKLTAEDIMEQEAREKVELFRNYYFVNYRTFEQDPDNQEYMEPVNMYFIVFKGGVLSFHFSAMPHPANVRRRIRQLAEHQYTDSDWISYAIIDNITDAYAPVIEQIEKEVDDIDDDILRMHAKNGKDAPKEKKKVIEQKKKRKSLFDYVGPPQFEKLEDEDEAHLSGDSGKDMLLRVGESRKKVMSLYRLLGNKADVIKGLAKRCNEQWEVAPTSDVGLYLGDIQDHIVTMTGSLAHYENILSRAHSNYLAQLNIAMNERAEQTGDVLGKLTVLGSMVLPLNIITGMWGMNVWVPGQGAEGDLTWFWSFCAFFVVFVVVTYFIAKKVYHLV